jgi:rhamnosyl/mannosyltransferase
VLQLGKHYPPHRGGMETHVQTLCRHLGRAADVRVLVSAAGRRGSREIVGGVPVVRAGTLGRLSGAPVSPGLVAELRADRSDVVHLHHPNPGAVLAWLAARPRGRLVVTYHADIVGRGWMDVAFRPVLDRVLGAARVILCTSDAVAESAVLRRHRSRCRVVPLGIDAGDWDGADPGAVADLRRRYGPGLVLGVGRLVPYKGFATLVDAMARVPAHLLLVGSGPLAEALRRQARASAPGRVEVFEEVDDLRPYYHAADVVAFPSVGLNEAFGLVQLEAMACGKPVVNTSVGTGVPGVSPHGETGLTVAPADAGALAAALRRLLEDRELARRFGAAGRRRVETEFSAARMASRIVEAYQDAVASGAPGTRHAGFSSVGTPA